MLSIDQSTNVTCGIWSDPFLIPTAYCRTTMIERACVVTEPSEHHAFDRINHFYIFAEKKMNFPAVKEYFTDEGIMIMLDEKPWL